MGLKYTTTCLGYQQITSLSSAAGLTVPVVDPKTGEKMMPTKVVIVPETQAVRWRDDGTSPTSSVGMPLAVGQALEYDGDMNRLKFIEQAASAKLNVAYYV